MVDLERAGIDLAVKAGETVLGGGPKSTLALLFLEVIVLAMVGAFFARRQSQQAQASLDSVTAQRDALLAKVDELTTKMLSMQQESTDSLLERVASERGWYEQRVADLANGFEKVALSLSGEHKDAVSSLERALEAIEKVLEQLRDAQRDHTSSMNAALMMHAVGRADKGQRDGA